MRKRMENKARKEKKERREKKERKERNQIFISPRIDELISESATWSCIQCFQRLDFLLVLKIYLSVV